MAWRGGVGCGLVVRVCCGLGVFLEAARKKVERRGRDGGFGGIGKLWTF